MSNKKEKNIWQDLYLARERAEEQFEKEDILSKQKEERFNAAMGKLMADAKNRGLGILDINASYECATGKGFDDLFVNYGLVKAIQKIIEDYRKDAGSDDFRVEMAILHMASRINFDTINKLLW